MKRWLVGTSLVLVLAALVAVGGLGPLHAQANITTPDEAVAAFTQAMRVGDYRVLVDGLESAPGTDPAGGGTNTLPLETAESQGLLGGRMDRAAHADLLARQRDFVTSEFGPTAWQSVTYRLERIPAAEKSAKWVNRAGQSVSDAQAQEMLRAYWDGISKREGVDLSVLSKPSTPQSLGVSEEVWRDMVSRAGQVRDRFEAETPVTMQMVDKYEAYNVVLMFDGKAVAPSGAKDFYITLTNVSGSWAIQGLQWTPAPPKEPIKDI